MEDNRDIKLVFDSLLTDNDVVFIVAHDRPDFDAIGATIGTALICKRFKKKCYIILNEELEKLETGTRKVLETVKSNFNIIKSEEIPELITKKSLLIAVDVNKKYLIQGTEPFLDDFHDIIIVDHHKPDANTINTQYSFINDKTSSACEEISKLIIAYRMKVLPEYLTMLLAGITLDTNRLSKNTSKHTYATAARLTEMGADPVVANNMFLEDFAHDRAIQRLVDNTCFPTYTFAIAADNEDSGKIYEVEDIAKAADYLLKYSVNATFAMAYIDEETVSISARSKGIIDVSSIMQLFGGGGNETSAAARIKGKSIHEVKQMLSQILIPSYLISIDGIKDNLDIFKDNKGEELQLRLI